MRSIKTISLMMVICLLLTPSYTWSADRSDPAVVQWSAHCDLGDGRRFLTDGSLLLDSRYVPSGSIPEKSIPPEAAQRLLQSKTEREFGLDDLDQKESSDHYVAPGSIQLNRKYIDLLRGSPLKARLRLAAKGPNDPVLILDGEKVVGVVMPMKT